LDSRRETAVWLFDLAKWSLVALVQRQREEGPRFWYNAYRKTELAE
jgi:hypothetical protein